MLLINTYKFNRVANLSYQICLLPDLEIFFVLLAKFVSVFVLMFLLHIVIAFVTIACYTKKNIPQANRTITYTFQFRTYYTRLEYLSAVFSIFFFFTFCVVSDNRNAHHFFILLHFAFRLLIRVL